MGITLSPKPNNDKAFYLVLLYARYCTEHYVIILFNFPDASPDLAIYHVCDFGLEV